MTIISEEGARVINGWEKISESALMEEDILYEFFYTVYSLPVPLSWVNWLRVKMFDVFLGFQEKFRGIEIVYYKFTDENLLFQARGKSKSVWLDIALGTVAVGFTGLFLAAGIYLTLVWVKRQKRAIEEEEYPPIPFIPPSWWEKLSIYGQGALVGAGLLALGLFLWGIRKK